MALEKLARLKSLFVATESAFSTDPDSDGSDYLFVPAQDVALTGTLQEHLERPLARGSVTQVAGVAGAKGGGLGFKLDLLSLTTAASAAQAAVQRGYLTALLEACALTETLGTGTTAGVGSTTTSIVCSDAAGIAVGSMIGWSNGSSVEVACVTAKSGNTLTVAPAFSGSPSNTDPIYSGASYVQGDSDPGTVSLHLAADGYSYTLTGCKGRVKLEGLSANARPLLAFEFTADSWALGTKASLPATTLPTGSPLVAKGGRVVYGTTETAVSEVSFDPGFEIVPQPSVTGTQGRAGMRLVGRKSALAFKPYFASGFGSDFAADTERVFFAQLGTAAGACFALYCHKAQITAYPDPKDANGITGHEIAATVNASQSATIPDFSLAFV